MSTKGKRFVRFDANKEKDFLQSLRAKAKTYFESNSLSPHAGYGYVLKVLTMLAMFFLPFIAFFVWDITNPLIYLGLSAIMGVGAAGIGVNLMHDANHGSITSSPKLNKLLGLSMNFIGGNASTWKLQHNVLHHSYTNIEGADHDISGPPLLRFSPHQPLRKVHRYQYVYAWFLYSLMTLFRSFVTDFTNTWKFKSYGVLKPGKPFRKLLWNVIFWKVFYFSFILVLPLVVLSASPLLIVSGFVVMHLFTGLLLALIFQCAHVMEECEFPLPDQVGVMDNNWAVHQLLTTTNFAPRSRVFSWFIGGLNFQIEHHLFQHVSHTHYRALSAIVAATAQEFGLKYNVQPTFVHAISSHTRMLRKLGRE